LGVRPTIVWCPSLSGSLPRRSHSPTPLYWSLAGSCRARRRLGWIRSGAERRWPTRTRPRGGKGVGLATMTLHAASRSLRYDATARPGNSDERCAPLRRRLLRGCPRGALSQPSRGPAFHCGWLSASFAYIGGRRFSPQARHRLRGRAQGSCHARRLHAPAARSRYNPRVLSEGVAPEKMVRERERSKNRALPRERKQAQENHYD
jgi:hypothetical protein